jgi:hypothetical protein
MIVLKQICVQKKKNYFNKSAIIEYKFYTNFIFLGISILSDAHFQILSTQNRQNTSGSTLTWNECHNDLLLDLHSWRSNFMY